MANSAPSASGFTVVTHVHPQQGAQSFTSPQNGAVLAPSSPLWKFLKGEPAVLGTVQIMIGVVILFFGFVTVFYVTTISIYSGIMFWGACIYITAGSLTVRAYKNLNACLVKASLGMNIFSTITAGIAIILHAFDIVFQFFPFYCDSMDCYIAMDMYRSRAVGIAGVMIVLSLLEFIVSICVSAFACQATCSCSEQVVYQVPPSFTTPHLFAPSGNTSETPHLQSSAIPPVQHGSASGLGVNKPEELPPVYTVTRG